MTWWGKTASEQTMSTGADSPLILDLDNTPPGEDRFDVLCTPLNESGGKPGMERDRSAFNLPPAWFAALRKLLEPHPGHQLPGERFCLWQMLLYTWEEWSAAGLRGGARRPFHRALVDADLNLEWAIRPDLATALREACSS